MQSVKPFNQIVIKSNTDRVLESHRLSLACHVEPDAENSKQTIWIDSGTVSFLFVWFRMVYGTWCFTEAINVRDRHLNSWDRWVLIL